MKDKTCCFFGHRKIEYTLELRNKLYCTIEALIINRNIDTFLFGSKSEFNSLCHETVTEIKEKYSHIKRIYVRAEYPYIDDDYKEYLLKSYEDTYYPEHLENAGRARYIERNREMINKSKICVVYYKESYAPPRRRLSRSSITDYQPKSGTKSAYDYTVKRGTEIINLF